MSLPAWVTLAATRYDQDSPQDEDLFTDLRGNQRALRLVSGFGGTIPDFEAGIGTGSFVTAHTMVFNLPKWDSFTGLSRKLWTPIEVQVNQDGGTDGVSHFRLFDVATSTGGTDVTQEDGESTWFEITLDLAIQDAWVSNDVSRVIAIQHFSTGAGVVTNRIRSLSRGDWRMEI